MPDIPEDAITAAAEALRDHPHASGAYSWRVRAKVVLEAAMPALERDIRSRIAASLRRAAEGRREYATPFCSDIESHIEIRDRLLREAGMYESAAGIIEDPANLLEAVPSWRWTAGEAALLREDGKRA